MSEIFKGSGNDAGWDDLGNEETEGMDVQAALESGKKPVEILEETYQQGVLTRDRLVELEGLFNEAGYSLSPEIRDKYEELANQGPNNSLEGLRRRDDEEPEIEGFEKSA